MARRFVLSALDVEDVGSIPVRINLGNEILYNGSGLGE